MTKKQPLTLIYAAFIAGVCSIIYELLIATTASYFLGDSVKYFSLTIGIYMASMGAGSFLSKYMDDALLKKFIIAELLLGLFGGISIPLLYFAYAFTDAFVPLYIVLTIIIGFLIGLEIPFLTRLMERHDALKFNIANILSFDYLGALIATIAFPFVMLPFFGVYQSSLIFGLVNMSIGFVVLHVFAQDVERSGRLKIATTMLTIALIAMMLSSGVALRTWDSRLYDDRVIFSKQTRYQKIVMTKFKDDIRLFLDGNLQFSSVDEHRYHEALVHVPLSVQKAPPKRVLLLGAGDGLAVRELLKYPTIQEIVLVDLDAEIIRLAKEQHYLRALNKNALASPKVQIEILDAFRFLKHNTQLFDVIIADLPDPNNDTLARLYSTQFFRMIRQNLSEDGIFVTQATSPYFATDAFWSIARTLEASDFAHVKPYHLSVPSFGEWGFVMASAQSLNVDAPDIAVKTRYLDAQQYAALFAFPKDIAPRDVKVNQIDSPILLHYYLQGWRHYAR